MSDAAERKSAQVEALAAQIAAVQVRQIDELSLIGHPTSFDEDTHNVVETALRLAARKVLEDRFKV